MRSCRLPEMFQSLDPLGAAIGVTVAAVLLIIAGVIVGAPAMSCLLAGLLGAAWLALLVTDLRRRLARANAAHPLSRLSSDPHEVCRGLIEGLLATAAHRDGVFRELAATRIAAFADQVHDWSHGKLTFQSTECWRTAYEKVLTAPDITEYRSVAWIRSGDYWQDLPGRQGMRLNYELLDRGVRIERVLILGWNVWPPELRLPPASLRRWIDEQHYRGVWLLLLRESDLVGEPELIRDFGIYGDRAVGELHLDSDSRTVSFTLSFEQAAVQTAKEQWARLKLFARPYAELVDQPHAVK